MNTYNAPTGRGDDRALRLSTDPPTGINNPIGLRNQMGGPQRMPVRLEQQNPNVGNDNYQQRYYQQQQQQQQQQQLQQQNAYLNFQQRPRFPPGGDGVRFQTNPNNYIRPNDPHPTQADFQRNGGVQLQGQRNYLAEQAGLPGAQSSVRPPLNNPRNGPPLSQQMMPPTHKQMDSSNIQQDPRIQSNFQKLQEFHTSDNETKTPAKFLSRNNSNVQLNPPQVLNSQQRMADFEDRIQPVMESEKGSKTTDEKEIVPINPKHNQERNHISDYNNSSKNDALDNQGTKPLEGKGKEKVQKDGDKKYNTENYIVDGLVYKNIKFFEENDTAKTPLTPTSAISVKKEKRKENLSGDVVKSEFHKDDYEGGVDDTPMIHPNLRSIYQTPSKVARIPLVNLKKKLARYKQERKSKTKLSSEKTLNSERPPWRSARSFSKPVTKHFGHIKKEIKEFNPESELLAFFRNSKSVEMMRRGVNNSSDRNSAKEKLEYKTTPNGDIASPKKTPSKLPAPSRKNPTLSSPTKTPLKSPGTPGAKSLPKTPESPSPPTPLIKKVPMNKIQVGAAPSPNLKAVRSKVGSLVNTTHKPGGGNVRIESHKIDFSKTQPRIEAKNDQYAPSGGEKKITQVKLQWSAKSKVGSLENATYKPGGGDKKIESVKLDFKEKAKSKVGSKDNVKHVPGGGTVKIENQKLEFKAQSKVGSLDNVKHKPGGGDIKIFDDKTYLKQISGNSSEGRVSGTQSFGDLSVVREVEGKSAPGTPGRKIAVKIKKTTTIHASGTIPTIKNITEVMVASQTPKNEKNVGKSPSKQQVKLTYSKLASSSNVNEDDNRSLEVVKVRAKENAPVLKPNLSNMEANKGDKNFEGSIFSSQNQFDRNKPIEPDSKDAIKDAKNFGNFKQNSESSNFSDVKLKNDSGMSKFLHDELAAHEKVGEMWKEINNVESSLPKSHQQENQQQPHGMSVSMSHQLKNNQQQKFQVEQLREPNLRKNDDLSQYSTSSSNQNLAKVQSQNIYQPTVFTQSQQLHSQGLTQQRNYTSLDQQKVNTFMPSQQNEPFNIQFHQNYSK